MEDEKIAGLFEWLSDGVLEDAAWDDRKPLLAHYTSFSVLEAILKNDEVWFSSPLYMNDHQEVRFAYNTGTELFRYSTEIEEACGNSEKHRHLVHAFNHYADEFANKTILDTYVFCLSEHSVDDTDGLLSMWRGYGGNGNGAAIVFDSGKIKAVEDSPLLLIKVRYATFQEQRQWMLDAVMKFCKTLKANDIPPEKMYIGASAFFESLRLFALFTKHRGFHEEREWRLIYMPDRDPRNLLGASFDYLIGPKGLEPKLKFKVQPIPGVTGDDLSLINVVDRILLGPTASTPMSKAITLKMLEKLGKPELKDRIRTSEIPFRSA